MNTNKHVAIIGGGPVGSLAAIYLKRRGYQISVFERRPDIRQQVINQGRSINLALSNRGLKALAEVGVIDKVKQRTTPMHGRMVHSSNGNVAIQPYGKEGQFINSISRNDLNSILIDKAEEMGTLFYFDKRVQHVDIESTSLTYKLDVDSITKSFDVIICADGAFSSVRSSMQSEDYALEYLDHGYKELHIPAGPKGTFKLEKNALHIWPRKSFMLIALPNPDGSFTCTLFLSFKGNPSFATLKSDEDVIDFFKKEFPDAFYFIPDLLEDYNSNPTSPLITTKCNVWSRNNILLIGDAAHTILPFYGQGMNAGFEDCRILSQLLDQNNDDWNQVFALFQDLRKPDTDAIAQLSLDNFIEMRDHVADKKFLLQKKIEAKIHELYPKQWIPLYAMVTFNENIRYSEAFRMGQKQKKIMEEVMKRPGIETTWESMDFENLIWKMNSQFLNKV
ncbi:FAD-dependent oxidoreductase [Niastella populi]|uniref:Kynurenine 3-monooxygenase n=1 Tax=Niastella populi TaxID=550983 RepID=A0A1V9GA49_9BACT|nr:NAD(P)/FAD-dependent oxidoreductase [Niastella populi]OQP67535.1 kynurenine 3-monooxygenase [Niastella populi]